MSNMKASYTVTMSCAPVSLHEISYSVDFTSTGGFGAIRK